MSFYGLLISLVLVLCLLQLATIMSEAGYLGQMNAEYAQLAQIFGHMISNAQI